MGNKAGIALQELQQRLKFIYNDAESEIISKWVFEKILDVSNLQISFFKDQVLLASQYERLLQYEKELLQYRPVQYVLEESIFYGLKLKVNEAVLIPRPETEELVDWCLKEIKKKANKNPAILDIGTGSGCIALAIKSKLKNAKVYAVDISEDALAIANTNAENNGLSVVFKNLDILNLKIDIALPMFDVIISNPPYITSLEKAEMEQNVLEYEPEIALFVKNDDPLQFYKRISDIASQYLKKDGALFFELNAQYAEATAHYLETKKWQVTLAKDLQNRPRMIKAAFQ